MHKLILMLMALLPSLAGAVTCRTAAGNLIDVSTTGATGSANGALFQQVAPQSTGTGVIDPFVRLQSNGCEEGYNSDGALSGAQADVKPGTWTHSLLLSDLTAVTLNGVRYLELLLDVNQTSANPIITLEQLMFFSFNTGSAEGDKSQFGPAFWDLDAQQDNYLRLDYSLNSGSGSGDMLAYIPALAFVGQGPYIYMFSRFGDHAATNDGFEEWATISGDGPVINPQCTVEPCNPVPEPGSLALLGFGLLGIGSVARKRKASEFGG